ncbi:DUF5133 domain-containing protein [Streptomyces sp. MUM 136J]|uniref:DUF5133 domain-containing protein n=1 Tax=Streptomyces sp. MUM 136J TaxID=2791992 RepID=UPI001F03E0CF|nr:DUF5133 domain-containing protein [Streptomyces sp. MUM 136J]MCH0571825.1 DUF5133 domain-containing protein [Streptomyces sp. MUM 136J]
MLMPDPKTVRILLTRYATLKIAQAERERATAARELEDVSYTLCVLMGTTSLQDAIAKADALLEAGRGGTDTAGGAAGGTVVGKEGETGLSLAV